MSEIDLKSSTLDKGLEILKDFIGKAFGPAVEEFGLTIADHVKMRRLKNQIKNLERAKEIARKHNIQIKQINLKALVPYLEGVSLEEDETLQEMWANMFVNYIDTEKNLTMTVFPDMLRQISSNEVKIIFFIKKKTSSFYQSIRKADSCDFSQEHLPEELENLTRLGIIQPEGNYSLYDGTNIEELEPNNYWMTDLGKAFLNACSR